MRNNIWKPFAVIIVLINLFSISTSSAQEKSNGNSVTSKVSSPSTSLLDSSLYTINRAWGDIDYQGDPWVKKVSAPYQITNGLNNRHLSIWPSHGRYFNQEKNAWEWQRPSLFCTTEDLFTQTLVVPYLIPMLENAGAIVFTPRERDSQKNEIIIDNNDSILKPYYIEKNIGKKWMKSNTLGFASKKNNIYQDNENPFIAGDARKIKTTLNKQSASFVAYQPEIPESGKYAVYVSYPTLSESVSNAQYIVFHKGQKTEFQVNQQMGGETWVYIGTFDFEKGCNEKNRVLVSNYSSQKGYVGTDAVRFGGGMGNIQRGGTTSGLPRSFEGARYYAQWAGAPYSVYSSKSGSDDYGDDINVRPYMTNWLSGGSINNPTHEGKKVPIELTLAIHSDAGFSLDSASFVGSLGICTTDFNDQRLGSGISRMASKDLAVALTNDLTFDLKRMFGRWNNRFVMDKNYSESRNGEVPSAILETLSHQNFHDMKWGQDPNFKFVFARSIYKTILKYIARQHGTSYVVTPLCPLDFNIQFVEKGKIKLSWSAQNDSIEPTAIPTSYNLYVSIDSAGFDNGTNIHKTYYEIKLKPGHQYNFKVTSVNSGGESFPSLTLSALYLPNSAKTIMIVNSFNRLASPAIVENKDYLGFDFRKDIGVSDGATSGWCGYQLNFNKSDVGKDRGLGFSGDELVGNSIVGNSFDDVRTHASAIRDSHKFNIVSCSSSSVENGLVKLSNYAYVDYILGLEKNDSYSLIKYKTFSPKIQMIIDDYLYKKGNLFVSGSYIGSDMTKDIEKSFLQKNLKLIYFNSDSLTESPKIKNRNLAFDIIRNFNDKHYAAQHPEIIKPTNLGFSYLQYEDGNSAAVAYKGTDYRCITMGFPFECIRDTKMRSYLMGNILNFLMRNDY